MAGKIKEIQAADFQKEVLDRELVVVHNFVYFV